MPEHVTGTTKVISAPDESFVNNDETSKHNGKVTFGHSRPRSYNVKIESADHITKGLRGGTENRNTLKSPSIRPQDNVLQNQLKSSMKSHQTVRSDSMQALNGDPNKEKIDLTVKNESSFVERTAQASANRKAGIPNEVFFEQCSALDPVLNNKAYGGLSLTEIGERLNKLIQDCFDNSLNRIENFGKKMFDLFIINDDEAVNLAKKINMDQEMNLNAMGHTEDLRKEYPTNRS